MYSEASRLALSGGREPEPSAMASAGELTCGGVRRQGTGGVGRRSRSKGGEAETAGRNGGARGRCPCPTNFDMRRTRGLSVR